MNNDTFNDKVIERIHTEHLRPRPRWFFITERWFFVSMIAIATFIGSIAVTTSIFVLTDHDWFAVKSLDETFLAHLIKTIPYVWIAVILISLFVIDINVKKIGQGYKYKVFSIVFLSLLTSIMIGAILFFAGAGRYLDEYFERSIPAYRTVVPDNKTIWIYPENGLLSGKIVAATNNRITLSDQDDQTWEVSTEAARIETALFPGKWVKITGEMVDGSHFSAKTILPWKNERK